MSHLLQGFITIRQGVRAALCFVVLVLEIFYINVRAIQQKVGAGKTANT